MLRVDPTRDSHEQEMVFIQVSETEIEKIEVDHLIAPLIDKLNKAKFWTEFSCSGHEEDAFGTMYIMFSACDHETNEKIRTLIDKCADYFTYEDCYRFIPNTNHGRHYIQLDEPTLKEMKLAAEICFGVPFSWVFQVGKDGIQVTDEYKNEVDEYIVMRPAFFDVFKQETTKLETKEEFDKYIADHFEMGLRFIVDGICKMLEILDKEYLVEE